MDVLDDYARSNSSSSTSEAEADSDGHDSSGDDDDGEEDSGGGGGELAPDESDPQKLLGAWLGQLENLKLGLDNVGTGLQTATTAPAPDKPLYLRTPRIDSYRFSMANLEDSQDGELDAILGELCVLGSQFDREIFNGSRSHQRSTSSVSQSSGVSSLDPRQHPTPLLSSTVSLASSSLSGGPASAGPSLLTLTPSHSAHSRFSLHSRSSSSGCGPRGPGTASGDGGTGEDGAPGSGGRRTDSPDNDSAFSDTVSMLSSESSASSGGGNGGTPRGPGADPALSSCQGAPRGITATMASSPTQLNPEHAARIKAEKIKIALEKIKEANIKKLFIKAFTDDGSAKSLLVDEKMSVGYVTKLLVDKNHVMLDLRWSIVEHLPDLYMERIFEDHENLVENLLLWTRDSKNKLLFLEKNEKYDLFVRPEMYFLTGNGNRKNSDYDDDSRTTLVEEYFSGNGVTVPEVEGTLYLKSDGKKAWKKHYFVLRASGLYYCPKGKSKHSKDLVCLVTLDTNQVYLGVGWKKKYKAPTEYGFAIKHPQIQTKALKYIKYLCTDDDTALHQWMVGIRIVKYGRQLLDNYRSLMQDMAEDDLEALAHARSFSLSSMVLRSGTSSQCTTPSAPATPIYEEAPTPRAPSSSGSGSGSEPHSLSATPVSTLERHWGRTRSVSRQDSIRSSSTLGGTPGEPPFGFDTDFPTGTIKRKPSVTPKIPLTNTTRTLAKQSLTDDEDEEDDDDEGGFGPLTPTNGGGNTPDYDCGLSRSGTLRRTLRRSLTDDRICIPEIVSTLRRNHQTRGDLGDLIAGGAAPPTRSSSTTGLVNSSPTRTVTPPAVTDHRDIGFPPPPPEFAASMESLLSVDSLPLPPPPDTYDSNLSLNSLPPFPPTPVERRSNTSLNSLPLPPSPLLPGGGVGECTLRRGAGRCTSPNDGGGSCSSSNSSTPTRSAPPPPPKPVQMRPQHERRNSETDSIVHAPPPFLAELKAQTMSPKVLQKQSLRCWAPAATPLSQQQITANGYTDDTAAAKVKSPPVLRKIVFRDEVRSSALGHKKPTFKDTLRSRAPPPPPPPMPPVVEAAVALRSRAGSVGTSRPPPPRRSEQTRLSAPQGVGSYATLPASGCPLTTPQTFLADLQRVMEKKWKVAQQLKVDTDSSAHAVMGFRDPPLPADVLCCTAHVDEKKQAIVAKAAALAAAAAAGSDGSTTPLSPSSPNPQQHQNGGSFLRGCRDSVRGLLVQGEDSSRASFMSKKRPPPPPKRSEATQLSTRT